MVSWWEIATYGKLPKRRYSQSSPIRRPCSRPCFMFYLNLVIRRRLLYLLHGIRRRLLCLLGIHWCPPVSPPRDPTAPSCLFLGIRWCFFLGTQRRLRASSSGSDGASRVSFSGSGGTSVSLPRDPVVVPVSLPRNPAMPPVSPPRDSAASLVFLIYVLEMPAAAPAPAPVR